MAKDKEQIEEVGGNVQIFNIVFCGLGLSNARQNFKNRENIWLKQKTWSHVCSQKVVQTAVLVTCLRGKSVF